MTRFLAACFLNSSMQEGMCSTPAWVFLNGTNILQYRHHFIVTVAFQMSFRFIRVLISNSLLRFTWNFQVMMGSWSSPLVVVRHRDWLFCNSENPPFSSLLHLQRCYQIISLSRSLLSPSDFLFPLSLSLFLSHRRGNRIPRSGAHSEYCNIL